MKSKISDFLKKHPDKSAIIIISLIFLFITSVIIILNCQGFMWGSDTDWKNQHFAIPEYFRLRFYETRDIFPDFALQIGGGQNIYNYSYYGIANPLYLPAYALPFLKMSTYIQFISLITVLISAILGYFFFKGHFRKKISLILSVILLCSGGLFYHSHHHIMFMNYFPFLMGTLMGCRKKNSPVNILLMAAMSYCIMCTSFYFSVGCFASVLIYMIYLELQKNKRFYVRRFIRKYSIKVLGIILGCLCSSFMWMPTFMAILSGREKKSENSDILKIFIPNVNLNAILYSGYSMGLTVFILFSAVYMLLKSRKSGLFLPVVLMCCIAFPIINCTMNAFMYIDGKSFIPLEPVMLLITGSFLSEKRLDPKSTVISSAVIIAMGALNILAPDYNNELRIIWIPIFVSVIFTSFLMMWIYQKNKEKILPIYAIASSMLICIINNCADTFADSKQIKEFYNSDTQNAVTGILNNDHDTYRFANTVHNEVNVNRIFNMNYLSTSSYSSVNNPYLRDFRFNSSLSENRTRNNALQNQPYNIFFTALMGCRYRLSSKKMRMYNEEQVADLGENAIYRNDYAFPLGYATFDVMGEDVFSTIPAHRKPEAIINNIIIPGDNYGNQNSCIEEISLDLSKLKSDPHIKYENGIFTVDTQESFTVNAGLENISGNKIFIVTASANNRIGNPLKYSDIFLTINGVKNKLTDPHWKYNNKNYNFTYVLSSYETAQSLDMTFSPGFYTISDIHVFSLDASVLDVALDNKDEFLIDRKKSLGDTITGTVNVSNDGWFNISLPYDKNFHITVDGKSIKYFRTNTAFIGFPIRQGTHNIKITYEAPLKNIGLTISVLSAILLGMTICLLFVNKRKI